MSKLDINASMNSFEAHADTMRIAKGHDRRMKKLVVQSERDAPMVPTPAEKAIRESQQQFANYEKTLRAERQALVDCGKFTELLWLLDHLRPESSDELVELVERTDWQRHDERTRHIALSAIDAAIIRLRVREGLAPFDDGLPGEPPTVFCIVRHLITGAPL